MAGNSTPPLVIAHRGASGYLPEHTREAKALAYGQGADYLEQDVVATRDGHLIVLHDLWMDDVTDVASRFPDRCRPDGRHYAIDFSLAEVQSLETCERRRAGSGELLFPERFADTEVKFRVVTLDEELRFIRELNRTTGRNVGLYPEIKAAKFHHRHGIDLGARLIQTLDEHGFSGPDDPVVIQCFDADELKRCRLELGTRIRLAQLIEVERLVGNTSARFAEIAEYAEIAAPHYAALVKLGAGRMPEPTDAAVEARRAGLQLHPFTFRRDAVPSPFESLEEWIGYYFREVGASGLFCDHPDAAVRVRDAHLAAAAR